MPRLHKYFGNPWLSWLANLLFNVGVGDSYCGMPGFRWSLYNQLDLRSSEMEFTMEFVIKSAQIGAQISEIPIVLWPDNRERPPHLLTDACGLDSCRTGSGNAKQLRWRVEPLPEQMRGTYPRGRGVFGDAKKDLGSDCRAARKPVLVRERRGFTV